MQGGDGQTAAAPPRERDPAAGGGLGPGAGADIVTAAS